VEEKAVLKQAVADLLPEVISLEIWLQVNLKRQ
jgi:hypothetical protein